MSNLLSEVKMVQYHEAMEYMQNLTKFGMNFGLQRITELLRRLGNPHLGLKVIHVGGTNGKGTTTALLAGVLQQAGYRVGTFTSPHLHDYTERYRINGRDIEPERVAQLITDLCPHLEAMVQAGFEHPTEFEVGTALAFSYFAQEAVDYLVLEVGLGGAIDSTNVVQPLLTVLTNVSMDHMDYLGSTLEEIATVKAGIIKAGVPVVTAADAPGVVDIITATCREKGCPLTRLGSDVIWSRGDHNRQGQYFNYSGRDWRWDDLWLPLLGQHQVGNAVTVLAALEVLVSRGEISVTEQQLRQGLASTVWPARLEILGEEPWILIDAAHNYAGARSLGAALDELWPDQRIIMVLGMLGDKERAKVVAELAPRAQGIIITKPNSPRAGEWQQMADQARVYVEQVEIVEDIEKAVLAGLALAGNDGLVCITGSFYMVADARAVILRHLGAQGQKIVS